MLYKSIDVSSKDRMALKCFDGIIKVVEISPAGFGTEKRLITIER